MTRGGLQVGYNRRAVIRLIALAWPAAIASGSDASRMSAREVVIELVKARHDRPADLSHRDLSGLDLADLDFKGANLTGSNLFGADLTASNLDGATLSNAILDRTILVRTSFANATLQGASIRRPSVSSDMRFATRDLPVFRAAKMAGVRLTAQLDGADFREADLSNASFAIWEERGLGGAPTTGLDRCDFTSARMRGTFLRGLSLTHASFLNADLSNADLRDTDLTGANMTGAVLDSAQLDGAKLDDVVGLTSLMRD